MYPYLELFWTKIYMTGIGIVLAALVFLITVLIMCKKYHQEFIKFFNRLPWLLLWVYGLGLYFTFLFDGGIIPTSFAVFSPYGYHFNLIWVVIACFIWVVLFLSQFRRSETKKVRIDILFFGFVNALIVLGVFLMLWDNFIGKPYTWPFHISALSAESALVKYGGVYPIGLMLSIWALIINLVITVRKLMAKKSWIGIWWFILLFILMIGILPFWNYPAHGVMWIFWLVTLDANHYIFIFLILYCLIAQKILKKPY